MFEYEYWAKIRVVVTANDEDAARDVMRTTLLSLDCVQDARSATLIRSTDAFLIARLNREYARRTFRLEPRQADVDGNEQAIQLELSAAPLKPNG